MAKQGAFEASFLRAAYWQCRTLDCGAVKPQRRVLRPGSQAALGFSCRAEAPGQGSRHARRGAGPYPEVETPKERHKTFDDAIIIVRAGNGGQGEITQEGKGKIVSNLKYTPGHGQRKKIWLPASEPADGMDGASVILFCDPGLDSLEHLRTSKVFAAKNGSKGNPEDGTQAPKRMKRDIKRAESLRIGVPPGTVIKKKGRLLGELLLKGESLVVARGGKGGLGTVRLSRSKTNERVRRGRRVKDTGAEVVEIEDTDWKAESLGQPGEMAKLHLMLRIVADVGIIGLPNAGKSSLLASLTRASPTVAAYPFTTLVPNLGVMASGGAPVLVDLPGLIKGAHTGRGLGRKFLRHLRRTRLFLHVVDGASADPVADYVTIREELRMYNPQYCSRPHVVVLNKVDLPEGSSRQQESVEGILEAAGAAKVDCPAALAPAVVVPASAVDGIGVGDVGDWIQKTLKSMGEAENEVEMEVEVAKGNV